MITQIKYDREVIVLAVAYYLIGKPVKEIEIDTGVRMSSVYYALKQVKHFKLRRREGGKYAERHISRSTASNHNGGYKCE